ncbi:ATP-binding protein [Blastococcus haudaquaticus]|uniref:histidine kinase n=1 Tax=Blastococcus haudaquaticus TaxID=1938745 RepID=A0A286GZG0_9ACTN|nr:ATP-binding protein [Blastococcus haudaquaticus]SOE00915.1 Signal transduction histidine kinase [Blastococcus haudaquaticus]
MVPDPPSGPGVGDLFAGGGECGRLMAEIDWATTSVGPVESWPDSLRFAVRTVLFSRFPTIVLWGPDLLQFYNDAYAPVIGAKHPAIGKDIRLTQPETWGALQPPIDHAMRTLEASWLPGLLLQLERHGYREETYFTVSHAPAFDDAGRVAGIHAICTEVTGELVSARRQRLLHELATAGNRLGDEEETVANMCRALASTSVDVPFAAVYLSVPGEPGFRRVAAVGCDDALLPETAAGEADLAGVVDGLGVTGGPFGDRITDAVVLPLTATRDGEPLGLLLAGRSPNLAFDDEYRSFYELVAGQLAGVVVNIRAFETERLRAESLAELDRAKTTFFSDVSHELRTPLTLLLGPIQDVLENTEEPLPAGAREQLDLALRNGQRLQRLVNDLLDFASIEAGRANPVRVETDVATFTAELAGIFRAAAERAGLRLTVDCPALDRPAYVDPRMWEKVVVNLLANAVKYTFVGGIDVGLRSGDDGFLLTVTDTGVGIVADQLPQLFERFHRVPGATARTREGTGIGLALVHELVALHGGTASVTSEPGVGSTFTVALPYGAPDVVEDAPRPAAHPSDAARGEAASWEEDTSRPGESPATPPAGGGVLVVDDNADMRAYLTRLLGPHWTVRTTANGEEALAAVAERQPDVVLTDVMMPRVDGFELLRALRADPATRHIPVIMLTARAGQEASVEGLEAGADDYLAKPFRADELIARVRVALERAAGRAAAAPAPERAPATVPLQIAEVSRPTPSPTVLPVPPAPRTPADLPGGSASRWRVRSEPAAIPVLRRSLRSWLAESGVEEDQAYDLLLAACEAATNAVEHAQEPTEPFVDVSASVEDGRVLISVRDHGQWRERVPSMDRGRGSTLMSAFGEITATPSPEGTTVVISSPLAVARDAEPLP